jgi:hypothetical protein
MSAEHGAFTALSVQVFPALTSKWFFHATVRVLICRLLSGDNIHLRLSNFKILHVGIIFQYKISASYGIINFLGTRTDSDVHPTAGIIKFSVQLSRGKKKRKSILIDIYIGRKQTGPIYPNRTHKDSSSDPTRTPAHRPAFPNPLQILQHKQPARQAWVLPFFL